MKISAFSLIAMATMIGMVGCRSASPHNQTEQAVNSSERAPDAIDDIFVNIPRIARQISNPSTFNESRCSSTLDPISDFLYRQPADFYHPKNAEERERAIIRAKDLGLMLQSLRLELRERFVRFERPSETCVASVRKALRVARVAEEMLGLWMRANQLMPGPDQLFGGGFMRDISNPRVNDHEVRAGDVILMRGGSFISAIIARIGDEDAHFSHLAIIGQDAKGKLYLIESLIETGVGVIPLDEWKKKHSLARMVLLRHKDRELGRKSGQLIYAEVTKRLQKDKEIPYDFTMNTDDQSAIFCSEVIHWALKLAGAKTPVPAYPTLISRLHGKKLLNDMGLTQPTTFSPSDIEIDPSYEIIREHRGIELTRQVQRQDAVASSVFHWKAELGYDLQNTWFERQLGRIAVTLRKTGLLTSYMQKHMTREMIADVVRYKAVAEHLEEVVKDSDAAYIKRHGYPMAYLDLLRILETERRKDCRAHLKGQTTLLAPGSKFHDYVGPVAGAPSCDRESRPPGF